MSEIKICLLGPVTVLVDGKPQPIKSAKTQALLALVGQKEAAVSRRHLASLLWESFPQDRAWANLRHALHQLKNSLPNIVEITEQEVALADNVIVDIHQSNWSQTSQGDFCQGLEFHQCPTFETWLAGQRSRWRDRTVHELLEQASHLESEQALEACHKALTLDPLSERAHTQVIQLLRERGDFAAARRQWDSCLKTTLQELGTVPSILSCWGPALSEDAACRVYLLGQPRLVVNGAITALPYQKTTALLVYLASRGEAVERQEVRSLLWPSTQPDKAAANLRHALHFLRKSLGDVLCSHGDSLWLDPARFWLDTRWLEESEQPYYSLGLFCEGLSLTDCPEFEDWLFQKRAKFSRASAPDPTPELKTQQLSNGNLPAQLTPLVGAAESLEEAAEVLKSSRLLTLVGPAGVGKTRLALELGRIQEQERQVWLVEFGSLFDAEQVVPKLTTTLGLSEQPGKELWEQLEEELKEHEVLLVLDNCEHLITATAELASELLKRLPQLKIIATSRELLRVPGEYVFTLDPLQLPPKTARTVADISHYASVELFVTRARASRAQFKLHDENAPLVAEIVRRLDGLPLAIELAAVRTRALSTKQIAKGLRDRFRLLRGGPRTVPQRQQTLEQALSWSHTLLNEDEKAVFRRLSVLATDFDLEAASFICYGEEEPDYLLDTLTSLIDRSLVRCREAELGFRYGMLESVRDFAFRELERSGEEEEIQSRHFRHFLGRASERSQPGISGLSELAPDHANFGLALDWALHSAPSQALVLAANLGDYWFYGGHFTIGSDYLERALSVEECPKAYLWSGRLHQAKGDYAKALEEFEQSANLAEENIDKARAFNARAQAGFSQADYRGSKHFAETALALWVAEDHKRGEIDTLSLMATAEICLGEWDIASEHLAHCRQESSEIDYQWGLSIVDYLLGLSALFQGHYQVAVERLSASLATCRELGSHTRSAVCLGNLGLSYLSLEKPDEALASISEGRDLAITCGYKQVEAFLLYCDGYAQQYVGNKQTSKSLLQEALKMMRAIGVRESLELVVLCLADTLEEEELRATLRESVLDFKASNESIMPSYLETDQPQEFEDALSLEEAVELALRV